MRSLETNTIGSFSLVGHYINLLLFPNRSNRWQIHDSKAYEEINA
jgi:hypothetical protein